MLKELVIAKCDKQVVWLNHLKSDITVSIYNKNLNNLQCGDIIIYPNVGRCVHTFFYHIVKNYYTLADLTFFSQDFPFDHIINYIDVINNEQLLENFIYKSGDGYFITANQIKERPAVTPFMYCDKYGLPQHKKTNLNIEKAWQYIFKTSPFPKRSNELNFKYYKDYYENELNCKSHHSSLSSNVLKKDIEIGSLINNPIFEFVPGGHYAVTKEKIHQKSIDFYKRILHYLSIEKTAPWEIERILNYIYDKNHI